MMAKHKDNGMWWLIVGVVLLFLVFGSGGLFSFGNNSLGGTISDGFVYDRYQRDASGAYTRSTKDLNIQGNPSYDCLGNMPSYVELQNGDVFDVTGSKEFSSVSACQAEGLKNCGQVRVIYGGYSTVYYSGGKVLAYKPLQHPACQEEVISSAQLLIDQDVIYVCENQTVVGDASDCAGASVPVDPDTGDALGFFDKVILWLKSIF